MQRFKQPRREWLIGDLREYFEYRKDLVLPKIPKSLASLYVSRLALKPFPAGEMKDEERIEQLANQGGPKLAIFEMWQRPAWKLDKLFEGPLPFLADFWSYDEGVLSSYMALLAQGQVSPKSMLRKLDTKQK